MSCTEHLAVEPIQIRSNLFYTSHTAFCFKYLYILFYQLRLNFSSLSFFALPQYKSSSPDIASYLFHFLWSINFNIFWRIQITIIIIKLFSLAFYWFFKAPWLPKSLFVFSANDQFPFPYKPKLEILVQGVFFSRQVIAV